MAAPEEAVAAAAEGGAGAGGGDGDGDEEALKRLEELLAELYRFRDRLPPRPERRGGHDSASAAPRDLTAQRRRDVTAQRRRDLTAQRRRDASPGDASARRDDASGDRDDASGDRDDASGDRDDASGDRDDASGDHDDASGDHDDASGAAGDASDDVSDPDAALAAAMEETVRRMEEVQVSPEARGRALELRARALGLCPAGQDRAEAALSRAVKLEPGLGRAWRSLGEARWRRGDLQGARDCFAGALAHGEDAEARRLLSMVLRAGGGAGGALRESLAQAEAAVRCDPRDGRSWYVLGNAYVSLFFAGGQSPEAARRALGAYAQAERVDPAAAANPDLHLNRATLLQFQEHFGGALEGLGRAAALAPGWEEPRRRHAHLSEFLGRLCALLANRGRGRGRKGRGLPAPLPPSLLGGLRPSPLAALRPGPNPHRALLGHALFSLCPEGGVPYAVGLADGAGAVAALTVYNAAPGWGVQGGDALAVPLPHLRLHQHQHRGQTYSFTGVRVPSPLALLVNGRRPSPTALAPARLALSNDPAPPSPIGRGAGQ